MLDIIKISNFVKNRTLHWTVHTNTNSFDGTIFVQFLDGYGIKAKYYTVPFGYVGTYSNRHNIIFETDTDEAAFIILINSLK